MSGAPTTFDHPRATRRRLPRRTLVVALAAALTGCATEATPGAPTASPAPARATEAARAVSADRSTLVVAPENDDAFSAIVSGLVELNDAGCVTVGGRLLIAPAGSSLSEDGTTVLLAGYDPVLLGSSASLGGGKEEIPVADADDAVRACLPAVDDVAAYAVVAPGDL